MISKTAGLTVIMLIGSLVYRTGWASESALFTDKLSETKKTYCSFDLDLDKKIREYERRRITAKLQSKSQVELASTIARIQEEAHGQLKESADTHKLDSPRSEKSVEKLFANIRKNFHVSDEKLDALKKNILYRLDRLENGLSLGANDEKNVDKLRSAAQDTAAVYARVDELSRKHSEELLDSCRKAQVQVDRKVASSKVKAMRSSSAAQSLTKDTTSSSAAR
jgi:hypothetical protein